MKKNIYLGAFLALGLLASCNKAEEPQVSLEQDSQAQEGTFELNLTAGVDDGMRGLVFTGLEDLADAPKISAASDFTTHAFFRKAGLDEVGYAQITWQATQEEGRIKLKLPKTKITLENISDNTIDPGEEWYVAGIAGGGKLNSSKTGVSFDDNQQVLDEIYNDTKTSRRFNAPIAFKWTRIYKDQMVNVVYNPLGVIVRVDIDNRIEAPIYKCLLELKSNELDNRGFFDFSVEANPIKAMEEGALQPVWKFAHGTWGKAEEASIAFRPSWYRSRDTNLPYKYPYSKYYYPVWGMSRELQTGQAMSVELKNATDIVRVIRRGRSYGYQSQMALRNTNAYTVEVDADITNPLDYYASGYATKEDTFVQTPNLVQNGNHLFTWQEAMDKFEAVNEHGYTLPGWAHLVPLFPQMNLVSLVWGEPWVKNDVIEPHVLGNAYRSGRADYKGTGDNIVYAIRYQRMTNLDYKGSGYANMISDDRWRMAYRWERNPVDHSVTLSIVRLEEEPLSLTIDQVATPQWWDTNKSRGKEMRFAATGRVKNGGWEPNLVAVWTATKAATSSNAWSGIFFHAGSGLFLGDNMADHKAVLLIKEPEVIK